MTKEDLDAIIEVMGIEKICKAFDVTEDNMSHLYLDPLQEFAVMQFVLDEAREEFDNKIKRLTPKSGRWVYATTKYEVMKRA